MDLLVTLQILPAIGHTYFRFAGKLNFLEVVGLPCAMQMV